MKAYKNIKFIEFPDILDIINDGRKSSVGRLKIGEIKIRYKNNIVSEDHKIQKTVRNRRGYCSLKNKWRIRRWLKRRDYRIEMKFNHDADGNE